MNSMKQCITCKLVKPRDGFHKRWGANCKLCLNERGKKYYAETKRALEVAKLAKASEVKYVPKIKLYEVVR